ncbi:hypothetical protein EKO04_008148 [Ascochyta lentis]|uniref:BTB domain-containing protein n=1 Tax=Ascochyta lentis TaxID=205686 RepID=A0A8H7J087_9PLEO|nr:hypothetical protein EKO04_008148 [Ascochyta lentis]
MQRLSSVVRDGALAIINVGSDFTVYKVHKELLVEHSDYFKRTLRSLWRSDQDTVTRLEDVDSDTFDIFVDWLYTQKLPDNAIDWIPVDEQLACDTEPYEEDVFMAGEASHRAKQLQQAKAYVLGNRLSSPQFKQAVYKIYLDELGGSDTLPCYHAVTYAFANLPADDLLLQLMVDSHCHNFCKGFDGSADAEDRKQLPREFLVRVMLRYSDLVAKHDQEPLDAADYVLSGEKGGDAQARSTIGTDEGTEVYTGSDAYDDTDTGFGF